MRLRVGLAAASVVLVMAAAGCGSGSARQVPGSSGQLVVSMFSESGDLVDINPIADHIPMPGALIYDTLLRRTASGGLEPRLATGWKATDAKTWRFTLRRGVTFQDGSSFDANDVATTMHYILKPANSSGYLRFIRSVTKVVVVDPNTVDFVSSVPNNLLPDYVNQIPILSGNQLGTAHDDHKTRLMGTGPYALAKWKQGESVLVKRNDAYWGDRPHYAAVLLKAVPEPSTRLADLQSRNAQVIADVLPEQAKLLQSQGASVATEPAVETAYAAFVQRGAFANVKVRQALYHAIDRKAIVDTVFGKYAEPATSVVPSNSQGYAKVFPQSDFDVGQSRRLLAEASVTTPVVGEIDTFPSMSSVAELVRQQAQQAGFDLKVTIVPQAQLFDLKRVKAGTVPRLLMSTSLDNRMFDAYRPLESFFGAQSFFADFGYRPHPDNQQRLDSYLGATDPAVRQAMSMQMQKTAQSDPPALWLYFPTLVYGIAKGTCYDPAGTGQLRLDRLGPCTAG